jgi:BolA protein
MSETRLQKLESRIATALAPTHLEIIDDSHLHAGHAGAADGRGHFTVIVSSERFAGLRTLQRHRLVYDAVGDLMVSDVHALSIHASTPDEA